MFDFLLLHSEQTKVRSFKAVDEMCAGYTHIQEISHITSGVKVRTKKRGEKKIDKGRKEG